MPRLFPSTYIIEESAVNGDNNRRNYFSLLEKLITLIGFDKGAKLREA